MEVIVAENAGFCFGVKRAVEMTLEAGKNPKLPSPIYTLGPLIHNSEVVEKIKEQGISTLKGLEDIKEPEKGTIIIRSHGVRPDIVAEFRDRGWEVLDTTCPYVKKAQDYSKLLVEEGYQLIIFGDKNHPEVEGILGHVNDQALVISDVSEIDPSLDFRKIGLVPQTTKNPNKFIEIINNLSEKAKELRVFNTICTVTHKRQEKARSLASNVDLMLVVGGHNSSNTRSLVAICEKQNTKTYHVQKAKEINPEWFIGIEKVGIVAGASTPNWIIKEVEELMFEMSDEHKEPKKQEEETQKEEMEGEGKVTEEGATEKEPPESSTNGEQEGASNQPSDDIAGEEKAEVAEEKDENEKTSGSHPMEDEDALKYSQDVQELERGQIIEGRVIEITDDGAFVDVGYKTEGFIPKREVAQGPVENIEEALQVDDQIKVFFLGTDDEGVAKLSKRRADVEAAWDKVSDAQKDGKVITGKVTKVVKGGLVVDVGLRGFIPASHIAIEYVEDLEEFVGKELEMRVLEVEKDNNNVVLSRRKVLEEKQQEMKEETLKNIKEGDVVKGQVTKIVDFGAFVDIGGIEGLLHISEMSWGRIEHPSKVIEEGEEIEVKVLSIDEDSERISLGLKQILPDPWDNFVQKYQVDDNVEGVITKTVSFGAFMEIEEGIEGLIHISQLARRHVETPDEVVKKGDKVKARIININENERKVGLSLKELEEDKQEKEVKEFTEQQKEEGNITIGDMVGDIFDKDEE